MGSLKRSRWFLSALVAVAGTILDVITTQINLELGCYEANQLVAPVINSPLRFVVEVDGSA